MQPTKAPGGQHHQHHEPSFSPEQGGSDRFFAWPEGTRKFFGGLESSRVTNTRCLMGKSRTKTGTAGIRPAVIAAKPRALDCYVALCYDSIRLWRSQQPRNPKVLNPAQTPEALKPRFLNSEIPASVLPQLLGFLCQPQPGFLLVSERILSSLFSGAEMRESSGSLRLIRTESD